MPRRSTDFLKDDIYHVYNRGNNRQTIFFERENYVHFLRLVRHHLTPAGIEILAYCLMPNHYHLLVHLKENHLSDGMRGLSLAYTKAINKRFERVGSLFQGRFQAVLVNEQDYLVHLVKYIHLNPVKAGFVESTGDWEFSSFQEYAGLRNGTLPQMARIKNQLTTGDEYQSFLEGQISSALPQVKVLMFDE